MKNKSALIFIGLLLLGCAKDGEQGPIGPAGPSGPIGPGYSEVTLQPGPGDNTGRDATLDPVSTTSNLGTENILTFGFAIGALNRSYRSLLYFDVIQSGLTTGTTIVDAILTLYPFAGQDAGTVLTCHLYPVTRTWTELGSSWNQALAAVNWSTPGGDFVSTSAIGAFTVAPDTTSKIDIHLDPSYVQGWLNGQINNGFIIKSDLEALPNCEMSVYSRDYMADPSKRPSLKLIYK